MRNLDPHRSGFNSHFESVGRYIVAFQQIEFAFTHWLALITNHPSRVAPNNMIQAMLGESSFGNLTKLANLLPTLLDPIRLFPPEEIVLDWKTANETASAKLKEVMKRVSAIEQRRNQLVHSTWVTSAAAPANEGEIFRSKQRVNKGKVEVVYEKIDPSLIPAELQQCKNIEISLHLALEEFWKLSTAYKAAENMLPNPG